MSAIATALVGMGHQVSGSDLAASAAVERLEALGVAVAVGHDAANVPEALDVVTISTAVPPTNLEVRGRRARGVPGPAPGRDPGRHRRHPPDGGRGRHPRQDHHLVDAGPGPAGGRPAPRRSSSAGDISGWAPGRPGTRASGWWSRPTRATAPSWSCTAEAVVVTNVEPDHLDYYGGWDGHAGRLRPRSWPRRRGRRWCAPTMPSGGRAGGRGARSASPTARRRRPTTAWSSWTPSRQGRPSPSSTGARPWVGSWLPIAGDHNARNASGRPGHRPWPWASSWRRPWRL